MRSNHSTPEKRSLIGSSSARITKCGIVHDGDFKVDDSCAANRTDSVGILTVKDGRKSGRAAFSIMFKNEIGIV